MLEVRAYRSATGLIELEWKVFASSLWQWNKLSSEQGPFIVVQISQLTEVVYLSRLWHAVSSHEISLNELTQLTVRKIFKLTAKLRNNFKKECP